MTRLIAYHLEDRSVAEIRPAPLQRAWMDATADRHAYLCVPLAIANQFGWEVLAPYAISAWWDGGTARESVRVVCHDVPPGKRYIACAFGFHRRCRVCVCHRHRARRGAAREDGRGRGVRYETGGARVRPLPLRE
jgi:Family of unknown function (DUF6065)